MSFKLKVLSCFTMFALGTVICDRQNIHHMMYQSFPGGAMCFRVFNGTNQFGCSTSEAGTTGVVHLIDSQSDMQWLLKEAKASPYIVVIPPALFNKVTMDQLVESGRVSGVLLAVNSSRDRPPALSPDLTCPNRYSSLADSCDDTAPWNPMGSGFLRRDWPIALYLSREPTTLQSIRDCFEKFNLPLEGQTERSLCSLQMKGRMYGAVDTPTCLRRNKLVNSFSPLSFCDEMGDLSVVSQLFPRTMFPSNGSTVLVTARLDAGSMFDSVAPGGVTTVTGIVTLMTTAHLLTRLLPDYKDTYSKNVMFALLNGEAQDYIGSSRVVYDMQQGKFLSKETPLRLEHLDQVIDLNQLDSSTKLHAHCFQSHTASGTVDLLRQTGQQFGVSVEGSCSPGRLPPSSLHSFLKANLSLPGVLLTDHADQYTNQFYNGMFDDSWNVKFTYANGSQVASNSVQSSLAKVAQSLALALAQLVDSGATWPAELTTNTTAALVDELLYCYLESQACGMFRNVSGPPVGTGPLPLYVGVYRSPNLLTTLTLRTLAHLTGTPTNNTEDKCKGSTYEVVDYNLVWVGEPGGRGVCMKTGLAMPEAYSPAFLIDNYNWTSGQYSTWAESVWSELGLRMFLKPALSQELQTLVSGLLVLFLSFTSVYWVDRNSHRLFTPAVCECPEEQCDRC